MDSYLLIESRDPFETREVEHDYDLAAGLARDGNTVTLFLVQNGVLPARAGAAPGHCKALADAGVEVLADDFSLRERGITGARLTPGVKAASIDVVVDHLAAGCKTIWL